MSGFADRLIRWQRRHGRHDLPWQADWQLQRDPYRVWLSEIMLQQTQVATVIPYYLRFLERFPALASLATAPTEAVMAQWSGLGYYARARNLHACAKAVMTKQGGEFPRSPEAIAALPGIGRSTANAIAVFCFGARAPILDGNVKRLLCRHAGIEGYPGTPAVERELWRLAESLLPKEDIGRYIQAQMDLGATVCTRSRPDCAACPLTDDCRAYREDRTAELPAARPRKTLPERSTMVLLIVSNGKVLLEQRPPTGIWGGLLSLPEVASDADPESEASRLGYRLLCRQPLPALLHTFSHFRLRLQPLLCQVEAGGVSDGNLRWLALDSLASAPLPAPIRRIIASADDSSMFR
jgi:A/G-specific adenine glycosylase